MTNTQKKTLPCGCGCGQSGHQNKMTMVRSQWTLANKTKPGLQGWMVLKPCARVFEAELLHIHAVEAIVRDHIGDPFLRRLGLATQIHDYQMKIHERRKGAKVARRIARQAVLLFLSPAWLRRFVPYNDIEEPVSPAGDTLVPLPE